MMVFFICKIYYDKGVTYVLTFIIIGARIILWQGCHKEVMAIPSETFNNLSEEKKNRIIEAALNEFAERSFENAMLSNIIKASKISRGSMYQYFEDKMDLFKYLFDIIAMRKVKYMEDLLPNPDTLPFLDLFYEMYKRGLLFSLENPKFVDIAGHLLSGKGITYELFLKEGLKMARQYYIGYIESDKNLGRIDPKIDSGVLADIVIDMTTNIAIDSLDTNNKEESYNIMMNKVEQIIYIFKKGVQLGE